MTPEQQTTILAALKGLTEAIGTLTEAVVAVIPEQVPPEAPKEFLSPVPRGYDTILGYLAKRWPETMADQTRAEDTMRDGWKLKRLTERWKCGFAKVAACPWLIEQGIFTVNAYPLDLLDEVYGETF